MTMKNKQLCTCSTLFCALLCHCLPRLQHGTSRNFLTVYTCFIEEIPFFPLLLISTLVAISICHFLTATRTHLQWHAGLACLEIRSRNEEAINSTRNMIIILANGFLPPTLSTSILFICFSIDLVHALATTKNTSVVAGYTRV